MTRPSRTILNSPVMIVLSRLASGGLGLVSALLIARTLGPSGRGTTAGALAVLGLMPLVVGLGTPLAVRRLASTPEQIAPAMRAARVIAAVTLLPSMLLALGTTRLISELGSGSMFTAFMVSAAAVPLAVLWISGANVLIALGRNGAFAMANLVGPGCSTAAICVAAVTGHLSTAYVVWATLAATVATFAFTSITVRVPWRGPRTPVRRVLRDGATFAGSQVSEAASYRLDQAIALPLIGAEAAGLYSVAATIALVPYSLGQAIGSAAFRHLAAAPEPRDLLARSSAVIRIALVSGISTALLLSAAAPILVPVVFGADFQGAVVPAIIGLVGSIAVVVTYVASSSLTAAGRGWSMTLGQLFAVVSGTIALLVLGPAFGAVGASVASSLGYWTGAVVMLIGVGAPLRALIPGSRDIGAARKLIVRGVL